MYCFEFWQPMMHRFLFTYQSSFQQPISIPYSFVRLTYDAVWKAYGTDVFLLMTYDTMRLSYLNLESIKIEHEKCIHYLTCFCRDPCLQFMHCWVFTHSTCSERQTYVSSVNNHRFRVVIIHGWHSFHVVYYILWNGFDVEKLILHEIKFIMSDIYWIFVYLGLCLLH